MKEQPRSIPRQPQRPPSMDYRALKREGIELAQILSGDRWTDYNEHDPGVTLLEELCYALTELGYKTHFPVEDLLFAQEHPLRQEPGEFLLAAHQALSAAPLTSDDYRRLIIDAVPEVKNAWLHPAAQSEQGLHVQGLYEVFLQLHQPHGTAAMAPEEVAEAVRQLLHRHRNLGEDFEQIHVLRGQPVKVFADLQIDPNEVGESVAARVIQTLGEALAPPLTLHAVAEVGDMDPAHLYDGPLPRHGWIDPNELRRSPLANLRLIRKSDLLARLRAVPGVRQVANLDVTVEGQARDEEMIFISDDPLAYPILDPVYHLPDLHAPDDFPLGLFVGNVRYTLDHKLMLRSLDLIAINAAQALRQPFEPQAQPLRSSLQRSDLLDYYSLQHTLPENYGVGQVGLPQAQRRGTIAQQIARRAYAKQLKGYLMLMEQLMLDHLSRLGQVPHLLAMHERQRDPSPARSVADHIPNSHTLLDGQRTAYAQTLHELQQQFEAPQDRESRLLDYLTSLFGEEFLAEAFNQLNRQVTQLDEKAFQKRLVEAKRLFLRNLLSLTRDRGQGVNYLADYRYQQPPSLQKKINLLFNLSDQGRSRLSGIYRDDRLSHSSRNERQDGEFLFSSANENVLAEVLSLGTVPENFQILPSEQQQGAYGLFFQTPYEARGREVFTAATQQACLSALKRLQAYLHELNRDSEGFYLVEHILLRPLTDMRVGFALTYQGRRMLFTPLRYAGPEARQEVEEQLQQRGRDEGNYELKEGANGFFWLVLRDEAGQWLARSESVIDRQSAEQLQRDILRALESLREGRGAALRLVDTGISGAALSEDPYSLQMSAVLPGWPARMQNERLREVLRQVISREAPAHLQVHLHWVSPAQMDEFETVFSHWQQTKAERPPSQPRLDELSYYLLLLLRSFQAQASDEAEALFLAEELKELQRRFAESAS